MKQGLRQTLGTGAALVLLTAGLSGCTATQSDTAHIFAAASLGPAGEELSNTFLAANPGAEITFHFAGSSALLRQIAEGAPADMFISADRVTMSRALELDEFAGATAEVIATNQLVLVTSEGNPGQITELADLSDALVAVCAPEVPCGTLTTQALDAAGVELSRSSGEANVSDVATKISTGAVDAGFVYSTDARSLGMAGEVTVLELAGVSANEYPMALSAAGRDNEVAVAFAQFLSSAQARGILAGYGFGTELHAD